MTAVPSDSHPVARLPGLGVRAERIDYAGYLMPRCARIDDTGERSFLGQRVTVAYPACLHPDTDPSRRRLFDAAVLRRESAARAAKDDFLHGRTSVASAFTGREATTIPAFDDGRMTPGPRQ